MTPSPLVEELHKQLEHGSGNQTLEVGIGNGCDCKYFIQRGNNVVGLDIKPGTIKLAKISSRQELQSGELELRLGDIEALALPDAVFDGVYSKPVLHSTNLAKSFFEISCVLKPGGRALIYMYEKTRIHKKITCSIQKNKTTETLKSLFCSYIKKIPRTGANYPFNDTL